MAREKGASSFSSRWGTCSDATNSSIAAVSGADRGVVPVAARQLVAGGKEERPDRAAWGGLTLLLWALAAYVVAAVWVR